MITSASLAGLCNADSLGELLDHSWDSAVERYLSSLAEVKKVRAEDFLRRAQLAAEEIWARDINGGGVAPLVPVVRPESSVHDGEADPGHNNRRGRTTPCHVQRELASLADRSRRRLLESALENHANWPQLDRLKELNHKEVSHR